MIRMNVNKTILLIFASLLPSAIADGAEVMLRERATVSGPVIRLGDVADISASHSAELKNLVTTPLFPTPAPGTHQFLQRAQIVDLLMSRGIATESLRFGGAMVVEIGKPLDSERNGQQTLTRHTTRSSADIETSLEMAIANYLADRSTHAQWKVELELQESDFTTLAGWGTDLVIEGAKHPRSGRQRFLISIPGNSKSLRVYATVTKVHQLIFARRLIERGSLVRASDLELRRFEGTAPSLALVDMKQAVGMEATRVISADSILSESHLNAPMLVKRGETVSVLARTGGITVKTMAVARQNGAKGDLVQVESLDKKQRYAASVTGNRRLEVYPTGVSVGDYARVGDLNSQRR